MNHEEQNRRPWHCVIDRQMRQVYLGRDAAEAQRLCTEYCVLASAKRMGDAMTKAAIAFGTQITKARFGGSER